VLTTNGGAFGMNVVIEEIAPDCLDEYAEASISFMVTSILEGDRF
jgi:hypothetical protein